MSAPEFISPKDNENEFSIPVTNQSLWRSLDGTGIPLPLILGLAVGSIILISTVIFAILLGFKGGGWVAAMALMPAVFLVSVFFRIKKKLTKISKLASNTNLDEPVHRIRVTDSILAFPAFLAYDRSTKGKLRKGDSEFVFDIRSIVDFARHPGSKNSPPHLIVTIKNMKGEEERLTFSDRIGKEKTKDLFRVLHQRSGLTEEQSPFSEKAQSLRSRKQKALIVVTLIGTFAYSGIFILNIFLPPLHVYSAVSTLLLYGVAAALPLSLLLKNSIFEPFFKKGFGTETPFWLLVLAVVPLVSMGLSVINTLGASNTETRTSTIIKKRRVRNKNSTSHRVQFRSDRAGSSYLFPFDEVSEVRTSPSKYKMVVTGSSVISYQVTIGGLGIPIIEDFQLSQLRDTSRVGQREAKMKRKRALKRWEAQIPVFGEPEDFKIVKYPNGQIRSKEPLAKGRPHGVAEYYHQNGQLYGKITWVNGKKHGSHTLYRENGKVDQKLSYQNGQLHGLNEWFDEKGALKFSAVFDQGQSLR